jgi:hypothetical protein
MWGKNANLIFYFKKFVFHKANVLHSSRVFGESRSWNQSGGMTHTGKLFLTGHITLNHSSPLNAQRFKSSGMPRSAYWISTEYPEEPDPEDDSNSLLEYVTIYQSTRRTFHEI